MSMDNFEIYDFNVGLGNEDKVLNTLGGNVETFESLGNFSGYNATIDPYCINLLDKPRKNLVQRFLYCPF